MKKIVFIALAISIFQGGLVLGAAPDPNKLTDVEKAKLQELTKDPALGKAAQARKFLRQDARGKLNRNEVEQFLRQVTPAASDKTEDVLSPLPPYAAVAVAAVPLNQKELAINAAQNMRWTSFQYNYFRVLLGVVIKSPTYSHLRNMAQETLELLSVGTETTEEYAKVLKNIEDNIGKSFCEYIRNDINDKMTNAPNFETYWSEAWIKDGINHYVRVTEQNIPQGTSKHREQERPGLKRQRDEEEQLTREFLEREDREERQARALQEEEDAALARRLGQGERHIHMESRHDGELSSDEIEMLRAAGISKEEIQQGRLQSAEVADGPQVEGWRAEGGVRANVDGIEVGALPRPLTDKEKWGLMIGLDDELFREDAGRLIEQDEIRNVTDAELLQRICEKMKVY